jgi:prepilin-type N-terminal cleavage/methylation domain-containing protein
MRRGFSKGFTLIEALAAVAILGVGISGVMMAMSSVVRSESRAREIETMHRLAMDKLTELRAVTDTFAAPDSGDFSDRGLPSFEWQMTVDPTGVEYLTAVTVTVQRRNATQTSPNASVSSLVFEAPLQQEGGATL